jgi:hypothetical protein
MVAIVALGFAYFLDDYMKKKPFEPIIPEESTFVITCTDIERTWSSLESTILWEEVRKEEGDLFRDHVVALRKKVGIRLSPRRLNSWLGPRAVALQLEEEWAIQFRPGLLWKITEPLRGQRLESDPAVKSWNDFWYASDSGQITITSSLATIQSMRHADRMDMAMPGSDSIGIRIKSQEEIILASITMEDSFPLSIELQSPMSTLENEIYIPMWPEDPPMIWIAGGSLTGITKLATDLGVDNITTAQWDHAQMLQSRWIELEGGWDHLLGSYWPEGLNEQSTGRPSSLSWYGVDTHNSIYVPEWGLQIDTIGRLSQPDLPEYADHHIWNDVEGWSVIRDGGVRSLDVMAQNESTLFFAEQWNTMQRLIDDYELQKTHLEKDVAILVNWDSVSELYSTMIVKAGKNENLGEESARDKMKSLELILKPMAHGDYAWLTGKINQDRLLLEGNLNHPKPWAMEN